MFNQAGCSKPNTSGSLKAGRAQKRCRLPTEDITSSDDELDLFDECEDRSISSSDSENNETPILIPEISIREYDDVDFENIPGPSPHQRPPAPNWSTDSSSMKKNIKFKREEKLLVPTPTNPYDFFTLFLDNDYLKMIVDETNKCAAKLKEASSLQKARINDWKDLTIEELKVFLGLVLHTGTVKLNRVIDYWRVHRLFKSCFSQYMSRNRFLIIFRCLHFSSDKTSGDWRYKILPVVNNFNTVMYNIYYPDKKLSLDGPMVLWRNRLIFCQDIKDKRHKNGIELYTLTDSNGIALKIVIYAGVADDGSDKGHTEKIVFRLLEGKLDTGHSIYMHNTYNSYELALKLLDRSTYCTGTLKKNHKDNPVAVITTPLKKGENQSLFSDGVHIGNWKDKGDNLYISTEFDNEMHVVTNRCGKVTRKPVAIVNYNKNMPGIDLNDQMLIYYSCERKIMLWYKKIFLHTLMMSVHNAYMLYNKFSGKKKMSFYDFRLSIIETLLPDKGIPTSPSTFTMSTGSSHRLTKIGKNHVKKLSTGHNVNASARKDCKNCTKNKKRVSTTYECKECPGAPALCLDCFFDIHICTISSHSRK